ncbi:unnamed protein product [Rodentolepis nana]|uniref:EGF-like domain-containing protein n=1 Tax=Rodentolepis nana TaxID=102285 RepID=A0A0R3TXV5_RODNA|nr:unnamed protein product [Rodentolepis nana]
MDPFPKNEQFYECSYLSIVTTLMQPLLYHFQNLGTLDFAINYENNGGVVENGENCDHLPFDRLCDIYFEICATDEDGEVRNSSCNFLSKTTTPVRNTAVTSYKFKVPYFTNQLLKIRISALDHDHLSPADNLGEFLFQFHPYEISSTSQSAITATSTTLAHHSTNGRRGGLHCEEELNACEYEESQLGHPPCTNGGHCVVSPFNETQFTCLCAPGWRGAHCEIPFNGTRRGDACDLETFRLGHSPCANGGHCVADTSNETTFSCLCAQGWQGPTCEVSSFKVSAVVVVLSVLLLFLTIGCIMGVVCYLRIFTVPKMRRVDTNQNGVELVEVNGSMFSAVNNLYRLSPRKIISSSSSCTATGSQRGVESLVNLTRPSSKPNEGNDEYEYDSIVEPLKCSSTKEVPEIAEEKDNYEPINCKYDGALKSGEAMCAVNNEYDEDAEDDGHLDMTLKQPLSSAQLSGPDGDDYEFLCENVSV